MNIKLNFLNTIGLMVIAMLLANVTFGQSSRSKQFNTRRGNLAIKGYDPVNYFTQNKAAKGSSKITHIHQGIVYRFSNVQNRELFKQNPAKYEPVYGGWCAYAMGLDKPSKVDINPRTFKIINGKLYLLVSALG